jgi:CubicO group peptidase (beta-lactamase class C family)
VTVRDLLAHRTGWPRADLLMFGGYDNAEIVRRLRFIKPIAGLRAQFTYQNQMYLAAGELIPALTGQSWADFVEARILTPAGMTDGNARGFGHSVGDNVARPHAMIDGEVRTFVPTPRPPYGAGGLNASAADLGRWLRLLLGGGLLDGARVVDANAIGAMTSPQTVARPTVWTPGASFAAYGLGWFLHDYRGHKVAQHAGNAEGWSAVVGLLPDQHLGVAVMSNLNGTLLPHALMFRTFDAYLGDPVRDWSAEWLEAERKLRSALATKAQAPDIPVPPLSPYAGTYEHPAYGTVRVINENGRLMFHYGPQTTGDLSFVKADTFALQWRDVGLRVLTGRPAARFRTGSAGVEALVLEVGDDKIEFAKR